MKHVLVACLSVLSLCGCLTLEKGTKQPVTINTPGVTGVFCTLHNGAGTWHLAAPGTVIISQAYFDLVVTCRKNGYEDTVRKIQSHDVAATDSFKAGVYMAGAGPAALGYGVDAMSGAAWVYPASIVMPMTEKLQPWQIR